MRRVLRHKNSKRALTLVELVVAMTLTAIFAGACVMLILPITKIYTHVNDLSRAEVLADTVVDSLRMECARTDLTQAGDVWITSAGNVTMSQNDHADRGSVLVIRRSSGFCETIFANSDIPADACKTIKAAETEAGTYQNDGYTSRAVYRLFDMSGSDPTRLSASTYEIDKNYVHFGYYTASVDTSNYVCPSEFYDFTAPFSVATYGEFTVGLYFYDLTNNTSGIPAFVNCTVSILDRSGATVYSRDVVLCFASAS